MDGAQSYLGNADSLITIDIGAIAANWLYLDSLSPGTTETAAVVKADAYGLGAAISRRHLPASGAALSSSCHWPRPSHFARRCG